MTGLATEESTVSYYSGFFRSPATSFSASARAAATASRPVAHGPKSSVPSYGNYMVVCRFGNSQPSKELFASFELASKNRELGSGLSRFRYKHATLIMRCAVIGISRPRHFGPPPKDLNCELSSPQTECHGKRRYACTFLSFLQGGGRGRFRSAAKARPVSPKSTYFKPSWNLAPAT